MDVTTAWNLFLETGSVSDYLAYREVVNTKADAQPAVMYTAQGGGKTEPSLAAVASEAMAASGL